MSLMDQPTQVVVGQVTKDAAAKSGLSESLTAQMMPAAIAMLMNGLKKNAATSQRRRALKRWRKRSTATTAAFSTMSAN